MRNILKSIYRSIIKVLPTKVVLHIENLRGYHKFFNENKTIYFGEKIQWLKLHGNLERYNKLVDKYEVRKFVEKTIGKEYLIEILKIYDNVDEIIWEELPNKFVLKLNTGSGYNIICNDKKKLNILKTKRKLGKWLKEDYSKIKKEPQYKNIEKKIICEKYIENTEGNLLDYKLYCFKGIVEFIEVDFDRFTNHTMNFYDKEWNLLKLNKGKYKNYLECVEKPKKLDEMIEIAQKLSKDLPFARIDLYYVNNKIYFGEITLTPAGGLTPFEPKIKDIEYAEKIDLDLYKKNNVLLISRLSEKKKTLDGVTIKCKVLKDFLAESSNIKLDLIDVDEWRKRFFVIIIQFFKKYNKNDKIVLSSSTAGAYIILRYLRFIHTKKDIYYFVAGGTLATDIKNKKYDKRVYINLKKIYVESQNMVDDLKQIGFKNVELMPNFRKNDFEIKSRKINNGDTVKFVFFGRVIKKKGIEEAIQLIKKLNLNNLSASLDIYGQCENEYLKELYELIGEQESSIEYHGAIVPNGYDEYRVLSQYDVFLFPTEHIGEGLPGALIDSYIAGLAVLASNWKYAKEYIEDGKNGFIFKYKDYIDMYLKAEMLFDKDILNNFKKRSKELSGKYLVNEVLKKFMDEIS